VGRCSSSCYPLRSCVCSDTGACFAALSRSCCVRL
jgi:hypothetical protein